MTTNNTGPQTTCRVLAYDKRHEHYLGAVADISADRLVLLSDAPIKADSILELQLQCADRRPGLDGVYLGTRVLWSEAQDGIFWAGLKIISAEDAVRTRLNQLREVADLDAPSDSSLTA